MSQINRDYLRTKHRMKVTSIKLQNMYAGSSPTYIEEQISYGKSEG